MKGTNDNGQARAVQEESLRAEASASATRALERYQRMLRDALESVVQVHRRELAARKDAAAARAEAMSARADAESARRSLAMRLGEILLERGLSLLALFKARHKLRAEVDKPAVEPPVEAIEALAPPGGALRFLLAQDSLALPLTRKPQEVEISPAPQARELWGTVITADATARVTLAVATGVEQRPMTFGRAELRCGKAVRLTDIPATVGTKVQLHRVRGEFAVIMLELRAPRTLHAVGKKSAAELPGGPTDAEPTAGTRRFSAPSRHAFAAAELEQKLWGGYATYALPALEAIVVDDGCPTRERDKAAWYLTRWFFVHEDYARALRQTDLALSLQPKNARPRLALVKAQCLNNLGRYDEAKRVLEDALARNESADLRLLYSTVVRNFERSRGAAAEDADAAQLRALNDVLERAGLAPLAKRDPNAPLAISNLVCSVAARLTDQHEKVSVVMPTFNAADTLGWVLDSVRGQTWRNLEVIVVDDLSTDNTVEIAERVAAVDPRVRVVRKGVNEGAYAARNTGLEAATGDLVMVHDSDDWSHPQRIELQIDALRKNPKVVAVKSFWVRVEPDLQVLGPWVPKGTLFDLNFSSLLFRRDLVDMVGPWDAVLAGGDAEYYSRLQSVFGRDAVLKLPKEQLLAFALTRENSLTRSKSTHLRTFYYGLRWNYLDSYLWWHTGLSPDKAQGGAAAPQRRFPVPLGNKPAAKRRRQYDLVLVSDFALDDEAMEPVLHCFERAGRSGQRIALFHWRTYGLLSRAPLHPRLYECCLEFDAEILSPGDAIETKSVLLGRPEMLQYLIEPTPKIECDEVVVLTHGHVHLGVGLAEPFDPSTVRAHVLAVFGKEPQWVPTSDQARARMAADARFPEPAVSALLSS